MILFLVHNSKLLLSFSILIYLLLHPPNLVSWSLHLVDPYLNYYDTDVHTLITEHEVRHWHIQKRNCKTKKIMKIWKKNFLEFNTILIAPSSLVFNDDPFLAIRLTKRQKKNKNTNNKNKKETSATLKSTIRLTYAKTSILVIKSIYETRTIVPTRIASARVSTLKFSSCEFCEKSWKSSAKLLLQR